MAFFVNQTFLINTFVFFNPSKTVLNESLIFYLRVFHFFTILFVVTIGMVTDCIDYTCNRNFASFCKFEFFTNYCDMKK